MGDRLQCINESFAADENIILKKPFEQIDRIVEGEILIKKDNIELSFNVKILPPYPRQFHGHETIRFINKELIEFNHVNEDGSICVHTFHSPDLGEKIVFDVNSLKHWIERYYINKEQDQHYEHIVLSDVEVEGIKSVFLFTNVEYKFTRYEYGFAEYSILSKNNNGKVAYNTYFIQCFITKSNKFCCDWSKAYQNLKKLNGIFVFIDKPPVRRKRFAITNWKELEPFVSQSFLEFLFDQKKDFEKKKSQSSYLPLLIGYTIENEKIHWQTVLIKTTDFPVYKQKIIGTNRSWELFHDRKMDWGQSRNSSYEYYFGRGVLHSKFTHQNILLIGVGAIGSIVAVTLTRGGAKNLTLVDHDIKDVENVCRSEYSFITGTESKVSELRNRLLEISPFIDVQGNEILFDFAKSFNDINEEMKGLKMYLQAFDTIIDCSTDYDVLSILDGLNLNCEIISLSITNHAKELICTSSPNIYNWNIDIHNKLRKEDEDLYDPTGCWTPTFKASYNDVNTLVQYAIKQINACYINGVPVRNFYLSTEFEQGFTIKLNQF